MRRYERKRERRKRGEDERNYLALWPHAGGGAAGEPVKGDGLKDSGEFGGFVGPG